MSSLKLHWDGGEQTIETGLAVVGRDQANVDVHVENPHVSRRHLELRQHSDGWVATDLQSTQGSFVGDARITEHRLTESATITLGRPGRGADLRIEVVEEQTEPSPGESPNPNGIHDAAEVAEETPATDRELHDSGVSGERPGGLLREEQLIGATVVTGDSLNVECAGKSYQLNPGRTYIIGRDPDCDLVSANPTVSRQHLELSHSNGEWHMRDLGSSGGTFVDSRRVTDMAIRGVQSAYLGDSDSGERVVLQAAGQQPVSLTKKLDSRTSRLVVLSGVSVVALVAIVIGIIALTRGGPSSPDDLSRASVLLSTDSGSGSGTIIDAEQGLILTNAHVAAPSSPGMALGTLDTQKTMEPNPDTILISVSPGLDRSAEPRFIGKVVASDGYLDLAVVKIVKTASGKLIDDADLAGLNEIEHGDSNKLRTGDDIRVIGYPGISDSTAATLTKGIVSGSVQDDRLSSNRAFLNIDADINPGNSGGTAVDDDGRFIGVPTLIKLRKESLSKANRIRPVSFAEDLIEAAKSGSEYTSPFITKVTTEKIISFRISSPGDKAGFTLTCDTEEVDAEGLLGSKAIAMSLDFSGFPDGAHQDLRVDVADPAGDLIGSATTAELYPFEWSSSGCATATIPLVKPLAKGRYTLLVYMGPNYSSVQNITVTIQ